MTSASPLERPPVHSRRHRPSTSTSDGRPKALLFCSCGREAPPREWRTERDGRRRQLVCPDCGETLTVR